MAKCKNCKNFMDDWCENVNDSPCPDLNRDCPHFCQQTNADRIRAMSDEDLARWICKKMVRCDPSMCPGAELCKAEDGLANGLVKWLQQPAEEV